MAPMPARGGPSAGPSAGPSGRSLPGGPAAAAARPRSGTGGRWARSRMTVAACFRTLGSTPFTHRRILGKISASATTSAGSAECFRSGTASRRGGQPRAVRLADGDPAGGAAGAARHRAGARIPIDLDFPGLRQLHADPDVFAVERLCSAAECEAIVAAARARPLERSPVTYAGWSEDLSTWTRLAARGPCVWAGLAHVVARHSAAAAGQGWGPADAATFFATWLGALLAAWAGSVAVLKAQEVRLQALRTSRSAALDGDAPGAAEYVARAEALLQSDRSTFEAPTFIAYRPGERLAPHFDANKSAQAEDRARGGQTLATLLLYLNDVQAGGATRFNRLGLDVAPRRGDALLFFPADARGAFDERLEHEGTEVEGSADKHVCRIWKHIANVPPPLGLGAAE